MMTKEDDKISKRQNSLFSLTIENFQQSRALESTHVYILFFSMNNNDHAQYLRYLKSKSMNLPHNTRAVYLLFIDSASVPS